MRYVVENGEPFIVPIANYGNGSELVNAIGEPLRTITAWPKGGSFALVSAFLAKHYGGVVGADLRQPLPTITATDHNAPVAVTLQQASGLGHGHAESVAAFLVKYYGRGIGQECGEPLHTMPTRDRFGLVTVTIEGEEYVITDIGMRMLQPHELAMAQGFPEHYQFAQVQGRPVPKYQQVRLIGNSVCPPMARAIVEANFTHERRFMPAPATARAVA
ncbi:putative site-specific DNA methylase [Halomonas phage QHHSV-1]|nr:putative site-specific DNA methylase [Halomonas phage QHHSV-1]